MPDDEIPDPVEHLPGTSASREAAADEDSPAFVGRFAVLRRLGEGGMGVVYAGFDEDLDRRVAIKVLRRTEEGAAARMRREAQAMAKVTHPNVAAIYEVGTWQGRIYLAIEFVKGETLREWLGRAPRSQDEILDALVQAGRGLRAAHEIGLVHRDFKPDNVMVGSDGRVRVLDFGLAGADQSGGEAKTVETLPLATPRASAFSESLTQTGAFMGTPAYMSPEQYSSVDVGPASDQFAFCVTLYEALYGERPFDGANTMALGLNVARGKIRSAPDGSKVPAALRSLVVRGLAAEPADRHPNMGALLAALEKQRGGRPRRAIWMSVATAGVIAAVGGGSLAYRSARADRKNTMLVAAARTDAGSPAQVAALLREVSGETPHELVGWGPGVLSVFADPPVTHVILPVEGFGVDLSPDGSWVLTVSESIARLQAADGSAGGVIFEGHEDAIHVGAFSPDGARVVTASKDGTARVWNVDGSGAATVLRGHDDAVTWVAFSPDGELVLTTSADHTARIWKANGSGSPDVLRGHGQRVYWGEFSPDGKRVVTLSSDETTRVWTVDGSGSPVVLRGQGEFRRAKFSPDGTRLLHTSGGRDAQILDSDVTARAI